MIFAYRPQVNPAGAQSRNVPPPRSSHSAKALVSRFSARPIYAATATVPSSTARRRIRAAPRTGVSGDRSECTQGTIIVQQIPGRRQHRQVFLLLVTCHSSAESEASVECTPSADKCLDCTVNSVAAMVTRLIKWTRLQRRRQAARE